MKRFYPFIFLFFLLSGAQVRAAVLPVCSGCSYATIAAAYAAAGASDTIELRGDVTNESLIVTKNIAGIRGDLVTRVWSSDQAANTLVINNGMNQAFSLANLVMDHTVGSQETLQIANFGAASKISMNYVRLKQSSGFSTTTMEISDGSGSMADQLVMNACEVSDTGGGWALHLLTLNTANEVRIQNCLFRDSAYGIDLNSLAGAAQVLKLYNCTFSGCTVGMRIDGVSDSENNLFANSQDIQVGGTALKTHFRYCAFTDAVSLAGTPAGNIAITASNEFVDQANKIFALKSSASSLNSGTTPPGGTVVDDFYGTPRPAGGAYDRGCYERPLDIGNGQGCPGWVLLGNAINNGGIKLTSNTGNTQGAAWSYGRLDFTSNFDLSYNVFVGDNDAGADGMCFVMHSDPRGSAAWGTGGAGMGYGQTGGVAPSVAVEMDTFAGGIDPAYDHIAINEDASITHSAKAAVQASSVAANIEDAQQHTLRVVWDAAQNSMDVYFDGSFRLNYTRPLLVKDVLRGQPYAWFGFTAATGGSSSQHVVRPAACLTVAPTPQACAAWATVGSAVNASMGGVTLTSDIGNTAGAAWSPDCLDLGSAFDRSFAVTYGANSNGGAGVAMLLQSDVRGSAALGGTGVAAGFENPSVVTPSIAFVLRTAQSKGIFEIEENGSSAVPGICVGCGVTATSNVKDETFHVLRLTWNPATTLLTLYFDGVAAASYTRDLIDGVFAGQSCVRWGFSASTGASSNEQAVYPMACFVPPPSCSSTAGKSAAGAANINVNATDSLGLAMPVTLAAATILKSVNVRMFSVGVTDPRVQAAVYLDAAGNPGSLVAMSQPQVATAGVNVLDIPDSGLAAGKYWLAFLMRDANVQRDPVANDGRSITYVGSYGPMPGAFGAGTVSANNYDIWANLQCNATPTPTPTPTATPVVSGGGLLGQYFDNDDFSNFKLCRVENVNFEWGGGSPDPSVDADTFSVRWTGQVLPQFSETYTFYTYADDGARLWVNNQLLIDDWSQHGQLTKTATIALTAGVPVNIQLDYYEAVGGAVIQLGWASPSLPSEAIPASRLFSAPCGATPTPVPTETPPIPGCLQSDAFNDGSLATFWKGTNISGFTPPGIETEAGSLSMTTESRDIWNTVDYHRFLWQAAGGDTDLRVKINAVPSIQDYAKAGLDMRASLNGASVHVFIGATRDYGYQMIARTATAAMSLSVGTGGSYTNPGPGYVRLARSSNTFYGYYSSDGSSWNLINSITLPMSWAYYAGVAATSHSATLTGTAEFGDFVVYPAPACTPSFTPTFSRTQSPTFSVSPTVTLTRSPTATPTASPTGTPTSTSTSSPTASPTGTPSWSPTATQTWSPSRTLTATSTASPTSTPSSSPTFSPSGSPTPSATPTASPTLSVTKTATASSSPTGTPTSTPSVTSSATSSFTPSRTPTATPTATASASPTVTQTATESRTPTSTSSTTATQTKTATASATASSTPTLTATPTPSLTLTASLSLSATPTLTFTLTLSATPSVTGTTTPSFTPSPDLTPTPTAGAITITLNIYDSSGALLRSFSGGPAASPLGALSASPQPWDPSSGALIFSDGAWSCGFDGKDAQGKYLANGNYLAEAIGSGSGAGPKVRLNFAIIRGSGGLVSAVAWPNPASKGATLVTISWAPPALEVEGQIYNQAGELVLSLGRLKGGVGSWELKGISDGIYIVALRIPGERRARMIKVAVTR